jgi:hypothetical protein
MSWKKILKIDVGPKFLTVHVPYVLKKLNQVQSLRQLIDFVDDDLDVASKEGWTLHVLSQEPNIESYQSKHKNREELLRELKTMNAGPEGTMDFEFYVKPIGNNFSYDEDHFWS